MGSENLLLVIFFLFFHSYNQDYLAFTIEKWNLKHLLKITNDNLGQQST